MESKLPEKISPVEYAGFFDFNEDGYYGPSVLNVDDFPNAEQIANEITKRYNNHEQLVNFLKTVVEQVESEDYEGSYSLGTHNEIVAFLSQLESK